jgi:hypothetical protein
MISWMLPLREEPSVEDGRWKPTHFREFAKPIVSATLVIDAPIGVAKLAFAPSQLKLLLMPLVLLLLQACLLTAEPTATKEWTSISDTKTTASATSADNGIVVLKTADNHELKAPLEKQAPPGILRHPMASSDRETVGADQPVDAIAGRTAWRM